MNIYKHQGQNVAKTWALMAVFFAIVIAVGWLVSYYYGNPAILYGAVIVSLVMNVGSYWFSDKIALAATGAKPVTRETMPEVWNVTENLAITAGLPMPKLYVIEDPVPNAFATGRNKEHSAVAVTSGLVALLDRTELEGVIAHELSHIGNKDMLVSTVAVVLVGFIATLSDFFLRISFHGGGDNDRKGSPILLVALIVTLILSPIIATLLRLAVSRKREFLADASGALLTRYPEGLASALGKISSYSGHMKKANHATAHLFIANPFGPDEKKSSFVGKLFATHPPVEERIKALRGEA